MSVATFPIGYPAVASGLAPWFIEADFECLRRQGGAVLGSGNDYITDRGIPQWQATLKTRMLFPSEISQWRGFRDSLRGMSRFFVGYDPLRAYPGAYMPRGWGSLTRVGGGAFDGTASLVAISNSGLPGIGNDVIEIGTLPSGLALINGDYVSLSQSGVVSLHRVLDQTAQVANGSGDVTVWVEPEVPAAFVAGTAAVNLLQPCAKFRIMKWDLPVQANGRARPGQATFTALSVSV